MIAHQIKPGDRFLDEETLIIYRIETVQPPENGQVVVVARYSEQQRTRTFTWDADADVPNITRRQP